MFYVNRGLKSYLGIMMLVLSLLIIYNNVEGETGSDGSGNESESKGSYSLTINENLITLSATNASLREIVEDIGLRMKVEVVTHISHDETISLKFDNLSLEESIRRLSTNHVYLMDSEKEKGGITKIVLVPKGQEKVSSVRIQERTMSNKFSREKSKKKTSGKSSETVPFKFEVDPSMFVKERK